MMRTALERFPVTHRVGRSPMVHVKFRSPTPIHIETAKKRETLMRFPLSAARPPHSHEWVQGRCACGFRLLRSGMMVKYSSPRNSCGCECHCATDGAERPLAEFRVEHLSRVTAQQSGFALRDLCRGCYREMRHADRVAHFVNW
jgi:hypothetical protein